MELSNGLTWSSRNDRPILSALLEREAKREKILEGKMREIRLKEKQMQEESEGKTTDLSSKASSASGKSATPSASKDAVESEYFDAILKEKLKRNRKNLQQHDAENKD